MRVSSSHIPNNIARCLPGAEKARLGNAGMTFDEAQEKLAVREEKELQRLIGELFRLHGIEANRSRMDRKKTDRTGWPDYTLALHGRATAIEVKLPGRKLDPEQIKVRDQLIQSPNEWQYFVVHSVAEVVEILRAAKVIK